MTGKKWLSLKIVESGPSHSKPVVHIGISKRVAPLAVRRNRVKRLVREVLRGLKLKEGRVYWLRVESVPAGLEYAMAEKVLLEVFK